MQDKLTSTKAVRAAFWQFWKEVGNQRPKPVGGDYPTDIRCEFTLFLDHLHRDGRVSDRLAHNATLKR